MRYLALDLGTTLLGLLVLAICVSGRAPSVGAATAALRSQFVSAAQT